MQVEEVAGKRSPLEAEDAECNAYDNDERLYITERWYNLINYTLLIHEVFAIFLPSIPQNSAIKVLVDAKQHPQTVY